MPIKNQMQSYRNRNGIRYTCWSDCLEGDGKEQAKRVMKSLREHGKKCFAENHKTYWRVFVELEKAIRCSKCKENAVGQVKENGRWINVCKKYARKYFIVYPLGINYPGGK